MQALRSLRGRVALLATLAVAGVLLVVGAAAVASFAEREREGVDDELAGRPVGPLTRAVEPAPPAPEGTAPMGPGAHVEPVEPAPRRLRPEGEYVRLIAHGEVIRALDVPRGLAPPEGPGFRTFRVGGERYRSLTRRGPEGMLLEVGRTLDPAEDRVASLRNRLLVLGLLGTALVGGLSWWLAGLALRPLRALRESAGGVTTTRDLSTRLPADGAPEDVAQLTASIN